jgi:hypothetical protein
VRYFPEEVFLGSMMVEFVAIPMAAIRWLREWPRSWLLHASAAANVVSLVSIAVLALMRLWK